MNIVEAFSVLKLNGGFASRCKSIKYSLETDGRIICWMRSSSKKDFIGYYNQSLKAKDILSDQWQVLPTLEGSKAAIYPNLNGRRKKGFLFGLLEP